jgi:hypothetical protein
MYDSGSERGQLGAIPTRRELSVFSRLPSTICVPAHLIPYVRSGLIAEFTSATDVLGEAIALADPKRWRMGLAQLDCARELLRTVGISADSDDRDLDLEVASTQTARVLLDALQSIHTVEVQRLRDVAATQQVEIPLREVPILRSFIADAERQLARATKQSSILNASDKRTPRSVKFMG